MARSWVQEEPSGLLTLALRRTAHVLATGLSNVHTIPYVQSPPGRLHVLYLSILPTPNETASRPPEPPIGVPKFVLASIQALQIYPASDAASLFSPSPPPKHHGIAIAGVGI
ncbi:hypothetical protein PCANC_00868 [Puccinia coronata f. sp. avenae]|uniref:Uncharacterized protein n=1 Tax=Puccinia coronata f. sp. avenae TaxID=200324 RepID=A0A2N5SVZ4_9BASI|nr:hypothetical protein PCANC_14642 [Puccinia coronata f. sp. avenae]PLW58289.1 hypothetical protein PCANC_00868 [Puccinia coronata f. sp. avenae]